MSSLIPLDAVEINAAEHCNLACVGCCHASPTATKAFADPQVVARYLETLRVVATIGTVRILGGEPLLHPQLTQVAAAARRHSNGARIELVSNGSLLHRASWEWLDFVDSVQLSRYPGVVIRQEADERLAKQCADRGVEFTVRHYSHFRLVHTRTPHSPEVAAQVFAACQLAHSWGCHTLDNGWLSLCPRSATSQGAPEQDRCSLTPVATLPQRLKDYLSRSEPLETCQTCLGSVGTLVTHQQGNRKQWEQLSHQGSIDQDYLATVSANIHADNQCYQASPNTG